MSSDHRLALPPGHWLAEYRIEKVLGQGGFGITYLARDTLLNSDVAIKELLPRDFATRVEGVTVVPKSSEDAGSFAWAKQRFISEARLLASLRHENIVHVYRFLELHGTAYMIMEFIRGRSLLEWMQSHRKPSEQTLGGILFPLLDGLECVHRKNILHRDISPENILITAENRPMLLDFGSARTTIEKSKTLTGIVRPGYSPIEQYQTDAPQGAFTDIYALAGVMIHAVTGQRPPLSMDRCSGTDPFVPLAQRYRGKYAECFLRALDTAFSVAPGDRPQSVARFRRMLGGDFSKGQSTVSRDRSSKKLPSQKVVPLRPTRRNTLPWLIVAALLALLAGGISIYYAMISTPAKSDNANDGNPSSPSIAPPARDIARKESYTNFLGMKFVPVPGTKIWFCAHQTRREDYGAYARGVDGVASDWENATAWNKVPAGHEARHPVVMVSWNDASAFCRWLSDVDSKKAGLSLTYRLPTWEEWSVARGTEKYPWGNEEIPPKGAGNFADKTARHTFGANFIVTQNYDDGFATTAPVESFRPNRYGLFDLGSNVQEWSADQDLPTGEMLVLGSSWKDTATSALASREKPQYHEAPDNRRPFIGFRCVLVLPNP